MSDRPNRYWSIYFFDKKYQFLALLRRQMPTPTKITKKSFIPKRVFYGQVDELEQLDLIEIQTKSWETFLNGGIKNILEEFFPIEDYTKKNFTLDLLDVFYGEPRYTHEECIDKKLTYQFPVYAKVKLLNKKKNQEKTQDVYFFNLPKMTHRGTFIISGIERCVIGQIVRAPGVYFTAEVDKNTGSTVYNAEIRPYIGAWLDLTISKNNLIEAKINKKGKFLATAFLRSFKNMSDMEIVNLFSGIDKNLVEKYILPTLEKDNSKTHDEAILEIYKKIRPGEPLVLSTANETLNNLFFNNRRYTLDNVGRYKINKKLGLDINIEKENFILMQQDVVEMIKYLVNLTARRGNFDDIDHLANRRVRAVGELIGMYGIRVGMVRAERDIKSRMSMTMPEGEVMPSQIVNSKAIAAAINSFYRTSQLSTIVDQTNPLSELDNLRRLTVGGPGGIAKERASFSIRDIAASQYGRIDPIRSPEGPNIGVVTYLAMYARVNDYGLLETPYRKVAKDKKGSKILVKVLPVVEYLQADDEEQYYITHGGVKVDENNFIVESRVTARYKGDVIEVDATRIDYIDYSPRQVVGLSPSLIPFLQHDEATRSLMGSNMFCQAVPLVAPSSPVVGTGVEQKVATGLNRTILSPEGGVIDYVDAKKLVLKGQSGKKYEYQLERFVKTNRDVVFDQSPRVSLNQSVSRGDVLIDGPSTEMGR